ncbi:Toxin-antitoxin system HicB family antitoxin [Candidatus Magnetomoraceae bacterium gMMP-1]
MIELKINLPDKLYQKAYEISKVQKIPLDEIIALSLAQKFFRIIADPYLEERAKQATGKGFSIILSQVPDVPPEDYDKL